MHCIAGNYCISMYVIYVMKVIYVLCAVYVEYRCILCVCVYDNEFR